MSYKIRKNKAGSKRHPYTAYSITVPRTIADKIEGLDDKEFEPEMTDEGLLFRVVQGGGDEGEVPAWARS